MCKDLRNRGSIVALVRACVLLVMGMGLLSGCVVAGVIGRAIPEKRAAAYAGLAGQSVGVMVWADRGVRIDWPSIQMDLANQVQNRLRGSTAPELKETRWEVQPASIVRYQRDHPASEFVPVTEVAPKLGVTRLVYIEVQSLSTRAEASVQMFRGSISATLKVVEINGSQATVAYEEPGIKAVYPPKSPPDGTLNGDDTSMYRGAVALLADEILLRLVSHEVQRQ